MDTSDPDITFGAEGVCSHCKSAEVSLARVKLDPVEAERRLNELAASVRQAKSKEGYDSVVGLSGGVDSSYTAWLAYKLGLRPLAVHFDNGWNSETAVANIRNIIEHCKFDLVTVVIDWREFRDLQRAFIRAGVVDIEMLSDHAIMASMFKIARQHGITNVLSGTNVATEHGMPRSWVWNKRDLTNIRDIHRRFGELKLKSFPRMGLLASAWDLHAGMGFKFIEFLDLANYRKGEAMETIAREVGWRDYGGKHYESVFTKFYQAYILPMKFGIDKRKVHLSALIRNGEISRAEALAERAKPLYSPDELRRDKEFVLKKLGFSPAEFDRMMAELPVPHDYYRSDKKYRAAIRRVASFVR
jgi:N-acetyl sugar amidotransferase